jgi:hypothetical protein
VIARTPRKNQGFARSTLPSLFPRGTMARAIINFEGTADDREWRPAKRPATLQAIGTK